MCVNSSKSSRSCGVCVKLKSLLKIHYRLYHRAYLKQIKDVKLLGTTKRCEKKPIKSDKTSQTEEYRELTNEQNIKTEKLEHVLSNTETELINAVDDCDNEDADVENGTNGAQFDDENKVILQHQLHEISEIVPEKTRTIHVNIEKVALKDEKPNVCNVCNKSFRLKKTLRKHKARLHDFSDSENESNVFELPEDDSVTQMGDKKKCRYNCAVCGKAYTQMKNFKKHCKTSHKGKDISDLLVSTDSTEDLYPENSDFGDQPTNRKKTKIVKNREYKCEFCEDVYPKASLLKKHLRKHTKEKPYLCDECGAAYAGPGALRTHKKTHSGEDLYPCEVCNKIFATKTRLLVHARIHSGEKPFSCEYCGRGFSNISGLKPHLRLHTGEKPYKCKLCDYASTVKAGLKQHMVNHGEITIYSCHLCDKKFRFKAKYKAHLIMHTGEKRHFCSICNRGFFYANEVNKHISTVHSQARPFKCPYCDQAYKRKTHVNRHMQSAHRMEYNAQKSQEEDSHAFKLPMQRSEEAVFEAPVVMLGNLNQNADLQPSGTGPVTSRDPHVVVLGNQSYEIPSEAKFDSVESHTHVAPNQPGVEGGSQRLVHQHEERPQNLSQHRQQRPPYPSPHKQDMAAHKLEEGSGYDGAVANTDWYAAALANAVHYSQMGM